MIRRFADLYDTLAAGRDVRVIVLRASGKHLCAGADFSAGRGATGSPGELYHEAIRLFVAELPVIAAVQGAAIGLGLACSANGCPPPCGSACWRPRRGTWPLQIVTGGR